MKIGILTFHEGINHGAFFQALCLQEYIQSLGHDVDILNYKNRQHWLNEYKAFLVTKSPFKLVKNIKKLFKFRVDQGKMKVFPARLLTDVKDLISLTSDYHYVVVGSDIVWDYEYSFTGNDPVYFGHGLIPKKGLISYAASMGISSSPPPDYVVHGLQNFRDISVRDVNTFNVVKKYTERVVLKVLDPTLLLDIDNFNRFCTQSRFYKSKYILLYAHTIPKHCLQSIRNFAKEENLKIVCVGYKQNIADIDRTDVGPFEWLIAFRDAEYVITSTFHGTIFSVLYEKKFLTLANNAIEQKGGSLLMDLGLSHRYLRTGFDKSILSAPINYFELQKIIEDYRVGSKNYLSLALQ